MLKQLVSVAHSKMFPLARPICCCSFLSGKQPAGLQSVLPLIPGEDHGIKITTPICVALLSLLPSCLSVTFNFILSFVLFFYQVRTTFFLPSFFPPSSSSVFLYHFLLFFFITSILFLKLCKYLPFPLFSLSSLLPL